MTAGDDHWSSGDAYEPYVGRWSRRVAPRFLEWLQLPGYGKVLDVGCGTGALSHALMERGVSRVTGVDPSSAFIAYARVHLPEGTFMVGDAMALPFPDRQFAAAVSGLVLNFVRDPSAAIGEMRRVTVPRGTIAAYVWDYAGRMELMRYFWDAAGDLNPDARALDEGARFPICRPDRLEALFREAGLADPQTAAIDVPTVFRDFDDYWRPFLGGQAPAPGYAMSLDEERRTRLRDLIRSRLPIQPDGTIPLIARAWAVQGAV